MTKAKKVAWLLSVLVLLGLCMPWAQAAEYTGTITIDDVFFRTSPTTQSAFHWMFGQGEKVTVTGMDGDFYAVTCGEATGYVMKRFVSLSDAAVAALNGKPYASDKPGMEGIREISDIVVPATSREGDQGQDVIALQQALTLKGFYDEEIDGYYGENTVKAVKKFQKSVKMHEDGIAGPVTIRGIFGKHPANQENKINTVPAVKATKTPEPVTVKVNNNSGKITSLSDIPVPGTSRPGDKGADVKALQQALALKGFYNGAIDGDYGEKTTNAVKAFQKSTGLSRDGIAGTITIRILFGKNPSSSGTAVKPTATPKAKATAKPVATPKPAATAKPAASNRKGMEGITKISDIQVPGTSRKGDRGSDVKALQQALTLKGFYSGAIDGDYGENTVKAVKAFQKSKGMSQDGVAGAVTIRGLFGKNPAGKTTPKPTAKPTPKPTAKPTATPKVYKTERLDWFNGGANRIPRGATFQVKDVNTGKVFTVRRWAGANHIDAEPKTKEDTAIMKSIYGGSWSWNRRAVLVKYNGRVYAGSMNGMPHGTSTIGNNNFDGHFCIHFYNSRTHATNRVDEAHQNAVARAMRATW